VDIRLPRGSGHTRPVLQSHRPAARKINGQFKTSSRRTSGGTEGVWSLAIHIDLLERNGTSKRRRTAGTLASPHAARGPLNYAFGNLQLLRSKPSNSAATFDSSDFSETFMFKGPSLSSVSCDSPQELLPRC
jgi:hypothetical protein